MKKVLIGLLALSVLFSAGVAAPVALAQPRGGRGERATGAFARGDPAEGFRGGGYPGRGFRGGYPGGGYAPPPAYGRGGGPGFAPPRALYGAPGGFGGGLRAFTRGQFLPPAYGAGAVIDPRQYHLRRPPNGYGWVTIGPNAYLTQRSTGLILDTAPLY